MKRKATTNNARNASGSRNAALRHELLALQHQIGKTRNVALQNALRRRMAAIMHMLGFRR